MATAETSTTGKPGDIDPGQNVPLSFMEAVPHSQKEALRIACPPLPSHRKRGIGKSLVSRCVFALMQIGISKCHLFVFDENQDAINFWQNVGWTQRVELMMMSQHN